MARLDWWQRHYFLPGTPTHHAKSYLVISAIVATATLVAILTGEFLLARAIIMAGGIIDLHLRFTATPQIRTRLPMNIPLTLLVAVGLFVRATTL
jgi:hypothetical protein